jgi:hypothetical protein
MKQRYAADVPAEARSTAFGIVPLMPVFFLDYDKDDVRPLVAFAEREFPGASYDIYMTRDGFHLVAAVRSWDESQVGLDAARKTFPDITYIWNCRKVRLRISPKWGRSGRVISRVPKLFMCRCLDGHLEKRIGRVEGYYTL